jgi:predicted amidohydrolase YtcJ
MRQPAAHRPAFASARNFAKFAGMANDASGRGQRSPGFALAASLLVAAVVLVGVYIVRGGAPGPTLYVGGPILTMDADNRVVEALAIDGERIVGTGTEASLRPWAEREGARVVDLDGRAMMPGVIDAHGHFPGEGLYAIYADLNSPPIGDVGNIDDLVKRLAEQAAETPEGDWVVGLSYDDSLLAERRHPTRFDLDRASTEHPVVAWHISLHFAVANTLALEKLGISAQTEDPEGGVIRRSENSREPDGVLEENATLIVRDGIPTPTLFQGLRLMREATRRYLSQGVTTAQSGYTDRRLVGVLPWMSRLGVIGVRMVVWPAEDVQDAALDGEIELTTYDPMWLRFGAVKIVADGSIQGYTGYLTEPYHVPPPSEPADYRGFPRVSREELFERVERYQRAGLQIAIHGNGDATIDDILDAYESVREVDRGAAGRTPTRHIVIHAQTARPDQLDRMRELGIVPSFFSLHTYYWGDRHREIFLGPERADRISPARSAADRGVRYTIHADSPVVPMEPMRLVWSAVNRQSTGGAVLGEQERITVVEALRAVTIDAAWQHFEEDIKGSLEPGKLADLVILSRSPLEDPSGLAEIDVVETIIGGRTVWHADLEAAH